MAPHPLHDILVLFRDKAQQLQEDKTKTENTAHTAGEQDIEFQEDLVFADASWGGW